MRNINYALERYVPPLNFHHCTVDLLVIRIHDHTSPLLKKLHFVAFLVGFFIAGETLFNVQHLLLTLQSFCFLVLLLILVPHFPSLKTLCCIRQVKFFVGFKHGRLNLFSLKSSLVSSFLALSTMSLSCTTFEPREICQREFPIRFSTRESSSLHSLARDRPVPSASIRELSLGFVQFDGASTNFGVKNWETCTADS